MDQHWWPPLRKPSVGVPGRFAQICFAVFLEPSNDKKVICILQSCFLFLLLLVFCLFVFCTEQWTIPAFHIRPLQKGHASGKLPLHWGSDSWFWKCLKSSPGEIHARTVCHKPIRQQMGHLPLHSMNLGYTKPWPLGILLYEKIGLSGWGWLFLDHCLASPHSELSYWYEKSHMDEPHSQVSPQPHPGSHECGHGSLKGQNRGLLLPYLFLGILSSILAGWSLYHNCYL